MAAIVVCVDWAQVHNYGFSPANPGPYIDVGTAAETLLLAAHSVGLGADSAGRGAARSAVVISSSSVAAASAPACVNWSSLPGLFPSNVVCTRDP
jgi:hypothetical protein